MAVLVATSGEGRNHGMAKTRNHAFALAAVVQRILVQSLSQGIARRYRYRVDTEIGPESLAIAGDALLPLGRCIVCLVDACHECRACDWIGPKHVKEIAMKLHFRCGPDISQARIHWGCNRNRARRCSRISQ